MAFNEKSRRVDELTADVAKRDKSHAVELTAKAKELACCEATRSLKLEPNFKDLAEGEVGCRLQRDAISTVSC